MFVDTSADRARILVTGRSRLDVFLVIGTSAVVYRAAGLIATSSP